MTTVGAVIGRLLAGRATVRGESWTVASTLVCRNGAETGFTSIGLSVNLSRRRFAQLMLHLLRHFFDLSRSAKERVNGAS
jgi:hypothetical protein